jgi:hypothetical protein
MTRLHYELWQFSHKNGSEAVHKNLRKWLRWGRFRPNIARKAIGSLAPSGHSAQRDYAQGLRRPPVAAVTRFKRVYAVLLRSRRPGSAVNFLIKVQKFL